MKRSGAAQPKKKEAKEAKEAKKPTPEQKHTFYVVASEPPCQFNGIIGPLDLYKLHVLVEGSTQPLQESSPALGPDAVAWYRAHLETQGLTFTHTKSINPIVHILWVNTETTPLDSYGHVRTLSAEERADPTMIAWKTYYIPCHAGTKKEALGFWVCASQEQFGPLTCAELFEAAL
jgi:hypothetical protein